MRSRRSKPATPNGGRRPDAPVTRHVPLNAENVRAVLAAQGFNVRASESKTGTVFVTDATTDKARAPKGVRGDGRAKAASLAKAREAKAAKVDAPATRDDDAITAKVYRVSGTKVQRKGTRRGGVFTYAWITTRGDALAERITLSRQGENVAGHVQYAGGTAKAGGYVKVGFRVDPTVDTITVALARQGDAITVTLPPAKVGRHAA